MDGSRTILTETTATDTKKVVGSKDSKFPKRQADIETFPTELKLNEKQTQVRQLLYPQSKAAKRQKRKIRRGHDQLIGDILEPALTSYKGMVTISEIGKLIDNDKHMKHWMTRILNLGLLRNATDEEVIELAKRQLIAQSHYTPNLEGGYIQTVYYELPLDMPLIPAPYYKTKEPSMHLVRKHIRRHLSRVFVLTENGRRVGEVLHEMKNMLSS